MANEVYRKLCETMARRGGLYPGMEIPEFYALAKELFSPEEAMVAAAMPSKPTATSAMAEEVGKNEEESATRFKVGQRVADLTVIGAYSEYLCLPERDLPK